MKKNTVVLLYFSLCILSSAFSQGNWTTRAVFPGTQRDGAVGFSIGTKGYVGTGFGTELWEWDQPTNTWTQKANYLGTGTLYDIGFSIGAKGYIGTGGNSTDFWEWDQATNIWTQKANLGGVGRELAAAFSAGTKGYVGIGYSGGYLQDFWQYDPATNTWTQKANFGGGLRCMGVGFSVGGKGYMGMGADPVNWPLGHNDIWEYDTLANTWTQKANCPGIGRNEASAFTIGQYGYVGVGTSHIGSGDTSDFWRFDPATNTWAQAVNYGGGLVEMASAFSIGCYGYLVTGFTNDGGPYDLNLWQYYDSTNTTCAACAVHANFQSSDTAFCSESGMCIDFTNLSSPCATSWQWTFFGATPDTSTQQNPTNICYYTPGTYPVILIASNGNSSDTLNVYPMIIFANLPPPPVITVIGGDTLISSSGSYYQWYFNGSAISGATDSFYVATQGGTYSVQITDNLGCNSLSGGVLITDILNVQYLEHNIELYPNPVSQSLVISHWPLGKEATVEIFNALGEKAYGEQLQTQNSKVETINCKQFAAGIYFVRLINERCSYSAKFVKQ